MKTTLLFLCMAFFTSTAFSQVNPSNESEKASGEDSKANVLEQFTPDQADWSTYFSKTAAAGWTHDPDGAWLTSAQWETAKWDGTVYNPTEMYNETGNGNSFYNAICPLNGNTIRGLREVFYATPPFADNANPTKAEVDEWHRIALNHLRALVGYNVSEDPADAEISYAVEKDHCMFARALWGQEIKFTTKWDADYPDKSCEGNREIDSHCGASFIPSLEDQAPYLPEGHPGCSTAAGAEGVTPAPKAVIPWSFKWSRALCSYLGTETFWGGHVGPFFHRKKFGFSFYDLDTSPNRDQDTNAVLRAKWTGPLMENIYPDPRNLSISDLENSALSSKLFPNPVDNELNIELAPGFNLNETKVNVMNTMGVMVASYPYKASLDVSKFASGVYILQLNDGKNSQTIKFIKK